MELRFSIRLLGLLFKEQIIQLVMLMLIRMLLQFQI